MSADHEFDGDADTCDRLLDKAADIHCDRPRSEHPPEVGEMSATEISFCQAWWEADRRFNYSERFARLALDLHKELQLTRENHAKGMKQLEDEVKKWKDRALLAEAAERVTRSLNQVYARWRKKVDAEKAGKV